MQRVKDWLIKKLGGYTACEWANIQYSNKLAKSRWYEERAERLLLEKECTELRRAKGVPNTEGCWYCRTFDSHSLRDERGGFVYAKYCPRCGKEWNNG